MIKVLVNLIDGIKVSVSLPSIKIEGGIYKIVRNDYLDMDDKTSIWEFFPGDIVKCEKTENGLKAKSLVDSEIKNREIFSMIYKIVDSYGNLNELYIKKNIKIIKKLLNNKNIQQRNHPIVLRFINSIKL